MTVVQVNRRIEAGTGRIMIDDLDILAGGTRAQFLPRDFQRHMVELEGVEATGEARIERVGLKPAIDRLRRFRFRGGGARIDLAARQSAKYRLIVRADRALQSLGCDGTIEDRLLQVSLLLLGHEAAVRGGDACVTDSRAMDA